MVTEPWYEFVEGNPTAADIRFGGWSAMLSGRGRAQLRRRPRLANPRAGIARRARRLAAGGRLRDRHAGLPGRPILGFHGEVSAGDRLVAAGAAPGTGP